jgi:formylglycine-generating enzyme required for sulfatase activity
MISRTRMVYSLAVAAVLGFGVASAQAEVTFDWAAVDQDLGNPADAQPAGNFGSVGYAYRISKHEVTNAQYAEFLNAKAASDPLGLYSISMSGNIGGITRSGASGSFSYATVTGRESNPVVYVDFYDTLRFSNWLHNGQGTGDTESGAYTLLGGTPVPTNANSITRNAGADFFLTSKDEWNKAAYYDPTTDSYFGYATSANTAPTAEAPTDGVNSANYDSAVNDTTPVGAYTDSVSPFGTFDQSGNVWEWNESLISGALRGWSGGSWDGNNIQGSGETSNDPNIEVSVAGFRVASIPEPGTISILAFGSAIVLGRRQRRSI